MRCSIREWFIIFRVPRRDQLMIQSEAGAKIIQRGMAKLFGGVNLLQHDPMNGEIGRHLFNWRLCRHIHFLFSTSF